MFPLVMVISLCREPPSVQMAAWWEIGLKEMPLHERAFIVMLIRQSPSARAGLLFFPCWSFCWTRHTKFLHLHKHCKVSLEVSPTVCFFTRIYGWISSTNKQTDKDSKHLTYIHLHHVTKQNSIGCNGLALRQ